MADNSTILEKLDGLVARFEEISTLITDTAVIADQKRYVILKKLKISLLMNRTPKCAKWRKKKWTIVKSAFRY